MLVRLLESQISSHWEEIKYGIEAALPPVVNGSEDRMNNILESLLIGQLVCWVSMNDKTMDGILTTEVLYDAASKTKSLLIYSVYAFTHTVPDTWISGVETLRKYALGEGCSRIVGYSNVEQVLNIVEKFGGDTSYRFLSIPL